MYNVHVAKGHIVPLIYRRAAESVIDYFFSLVYFLLKKQFSHFFEIRQCGLIISFTEAARPDGVLIELNPLFKWLREHHCAYPAVSKGQCFVPIVCRGLIPKKCGSIHSYSFRYLYFNMVVGYNPLYYSIFCLG